MWFKVPWATCSHEWNTINCRDAFPNYTSSDSCQQYNESDHLPHDNVTTSAAQEFFEWELAFMEFFVSYIAS